MDNIELSRNQRMLKRLTVREYEDISYEEQLWRLKLLRKPSGSNVRLNSSDKAAFELIFGLSDTKQN